MSDTIPIHQVGPNCWDSIPRECGGARRAERRAARNNRIECPLNRNARRSRGGTLTAMFTRARLYALPYPFSQASHASALLYCKNRIYDLLKSTTASACSSTVVSSGQATKNKTNPAPIIWHKPRQQKSAWRNEICYSTENLESTPRKFQKMQNTRENMNSGSTVSQSKTWKSPD
jgi:hypothetical protein